MVPSSQSPRMQKAEEGLFFHKSTLSNLLNSRNLTKWLSFPHTHPATQIWKFVEGLFSRKSTLNTKASFKLKEPHKTALSPQSTQIWKFGRGTLYH